MVKKVWNRDLRGKMTNDEQIGKVFRAVGRDVRQCVVCEQLFGRQAAAEHAEVNCYPAIEFCLLDPQGGKNVTD